MKSLPPKILHELRERADPVDLGNEEKDEDVAEWFVASERDTPRPEIVDSITEKAAVTFRRFHGDVALDVLSSIPPS